MVAALQRILIIQLRQLGDILLTTPCVRELRRAYPDGRITFLCHSMGRLVLEENPFLDEQFYYDAGGAWYEWQVMRTLRERSFDLVFDFMSNPRSALYTLMTGAPRRVAFDTRRRFAATEIVSRSDESDYIVREKFRLLEAAGVAASDESLALPWGEQHTRPLMELMGREAGFRAARWRVVLSPTHRREARRWPIAAYAAIAERLYARGDTAIVWTWGPGEEAVIDAAVALTQVPTIKAPKTGFRELAALIANCDLFIGNSNGPSHVAVATATPSLQLHGPTQARAWCPLTPLHQAVSAPGGILAALGVDAVWDAVVAHAPVLEKSADARRQVGVRLKWTRT